MEILYTAREIFDSSFKAEAISCQKEGNCNQPGGKSWEDYISWSGLYHLRELISLDSLLNERLNELNDWHKEEYWTYSVQDNLFNTGFFTSLAYVLRMTKNKERFNLMAVVKEPMEDCKGIRLDGFDFIGYELLDKDYSISAITNCGGFDETFLPTELNQFGLVEDLAKAYDIKKRLRENNPQEFHADTHVIAIWRHRRIGRWRRY